MLNQKYSLPFLKHVKLENFMGFQEWEHDLFDLTVLVGDNTRGKTSVLDGIQVALGAILQCIEELPSTRQFRRQILDSERYSPFDSFSKGYRPGVGKTRVSVTSGLIDCSPSFDTNVSWYRELIGSTTSHNLACIGGLQGWVHAAMDSRRKDETDHRYTENSILPVVLSFGTNRLASQIRLTKSTKERMSRLELAYKAALADKVDFASAHSWFVNSEKNISEEKEFKGTRDAFVKALLTAIPSISEVGINWAYGELEAMVEAEEGGRERHHFSQMSDGYKAMINLVSEIAHRCIELNGFMGEKAIDNTPGIVLIDEIDIYLHPKWQRHVLADLKKAFPLIQFIVTTHSPFVVQSAPKDGLIVLDRELQNDDNQLASLEDVAIKYMGMTEDTRRSEKYNRMVELATEYFEIIKNGGTLTEEQEKRLNDIEAENSSDPAYVALLKAERATR